MLQNFTTSCPVCRSEEAKEVIDKFNYAQVANCFCPEGRDKDRNERLRVAVKNLWKQDVGYFLRCKICGFGFGFPFVGGDDAYYKILHEQAQYPKSRWEYDMTFTGFFKDHPPHKVLDIGAGAGYFLDMIGNVSKYALEGSDTTRAILKQKNINVYDDEGKLVAENKGTFNYVTMFQVLEHIAEFEKIIIMINRLLCMQGYLIISVPDCDAMIDQGRLTGFPDTFPNHINKFTPHSLEMVLKRCGFTVDKLVYEPASLKKFFDSVYLRILHKATIKGSLAESIYKIKTKKIRVVFIMLYSLLEVPSLIFNYKKLDRKGSFLVKAKKIAAFDSNN
jgi:SAM-dependent methyltransferase